MCACTLTTCAKRSKKTPQIPNTSRPNAASATVSSTSNAKTPRRSSGTSVPLLPHSQPFAKIPFHVRGDPVHRLETLLLQVRQHAINIVFHAPKLNAYLVALKSCQHIAGSRLIFRQPHAAH